MSPGCSSHVKRLEMPMILPAERGVPAAPDSSALLNPLKKILFLGWLLGLPALWTGCTTTAPPAPTEWPIYKLSPEKIVRLNSPDEKSFGASGLLLTAQGDLLTVSDSGPTLYRILLPEAGEAAHLLPLNNCFSARQLRGLHPYGNRYDCEGIAQDDQGRFYLCEEGSRWILRCRPGSDQAEVLPIDWNPVRNFFSADRNASFEGITIGRGNLYVANERSSPVILVLDLKTLKIIDHFVVQPRTASLLGFLHYSDLSWSDGKLYVLCRHHRVVLEVEPKTHTVLAEYNYRQLEDDLGYETLFPTGVMEGLAVDRDSIWLVTDNNGLGRKDAPEDLRPTLVKCRRPAAK